MHIHRRGLRRLRELRGLNALELAARVGCPVGMVVRAEMGLQIPDSKADRAALAAAYGLEPIEFVRLALDEADRQVRRR
jgi:transcriptional regulator with XRE-family HTH domain